MIHRVKGAVRAGIHPVHAEVDGSELEEAVLVGAGPALAHQLGQAQGPLFPQRVVRPQMHHRQDGVGGVFVGMFDIGQARGEAGFQVRLAEDAAGEPFLGCVDHRVLEPDQHRRPPAAHLDIIAPTAAELAVRQLALGNPPVDDVGQFLQSLALEVGPVRRLWVRKIRSA